MSTNVLLLNASYEPLGTISWQRAVSLIVLGSGELVEQHGDREIRSAGGFIMPYPSVVRLVRYVRARRRGQAGFSRRNLRARDGGVCQVVACQAPGTTVDHVVPRSKGGDTSWENCVLMCAEHNTAKRNRTPAEAGMRLKSTPQAPTVPALAVRTYDARDEWTPWLASWT